MSTPTLAERVTALEGKTETALEFRQWGIAIIAGGILSLAAAGAMYGSAMARLDRVAADVAEIREELNARGSMHARAE